MQVVLVVILYIGWLSDIKEVCMKYADIKNGRVEGYYDSEIHDEIPSTARAITDELWSILLDKNSVDLDSELPDKEVLTEEDVVHFKKRAQVALLDISDDDPYVQIHTLQAKYDELEAKYNTILNILGGYL